MAVVNMIEEFLVTNYDNDTSAGQGDVVPGTRIDMEGFHGCLFLIKVGTITGAGTVTATVRHAATDVAGVKTTLASRAVGYRDCARLRSTYASYTSSGTGRKKPRSRANDGGSAQGISTVSTRFARS